MVSFGFFNSSNGDRKYSADDVSRIFSYLITDGVLMTYGDKFFTTPATANLGVVLGTGWAWFNHTWTQSDTAIPFELDEPDPSLDRFDTVYLKVDRRSLGRMNSLGVVKGTAAINPVVPTFPTETDVFYHPLAYVKVRHGVTRIAASDIEILCGKTQAPFITSILQTTDITTLFQGWSEQFGTKMTEWENEVDTLETSLTSNVNALITSGNQQLQTQQSQFTTQLSNQQTTFTTSLNGWEADFQTWFDNLQTYLSQDVVTEIWADLQALETNKVNVSDKATIATSSTDNTKWVTKSVVSNQIASTAMLKTLILKSKGSNFPIKLPTVVQWGGAFPFLNDVTGTVKGFCANAHGAKDTFCYFSMPISLDASSSTISVVAFGDDETLKSKTAIYTFSNGGTSDNVFKRVMSYGCILVEDTLYISLCLKVGLKTETTESNWKTQFVLITLSNLTNTSGSLSIRVFQSSALTISSTSVASAYLIVSESKICFGSVLNISKNAMNSTIYMAIPSVNTVRSVNFKPPSDYAFSDRTHVFIGYLPDYGGDSKYLYAFGIISYSSTAVFVIDTTNPSSTSNNHYGILSVSFTSSSKADNKFPILVCSSYYGSYKLNIRLVGVNTGVIFYNSSSNLAFDDAIHTISPNLLFTDAKGTDYTYPETIWMLGTCYVPKTAYANHNGSFSGTKARMLFLTIPSGGVEMSNVIEGNDVALTATYHKGEGLIISTYGAYAIPKKIYRLENVASDTRQIIELYAPFETGTVNPTNATAGFTEGISVGKHLLLWSSNTNSYHYYVLNKDAFYNKST